MRLLLINDIGRAPAPRRRGATPVVALALALAAMAACVGVSYQRRAEHITPRAGETLVFGQLRFVHDGREFFPWGTTLFPAANTERHVWLLRLDRRAISAELHPDGDGSLAIWLSPGDYALVGSTQPVDASSTAREVVALFRVPSATVAAYAGELTFTTESHEGAYLARGEFGASSVQVQSIDSARATLERRLGTLPEPPVVAAWCAGEALPEFDDPKLAAHASALLDAGCRGQR